IFILIRKCFVICFFTSDYKCCGSIKKNNNCVNLVYLVSVWVICRVVNFKGGIFMKTKKLLTILGASALSVSVLAACGDDPAEEETPVDETPTQEVPGDTPPPADNEPPATEDG